MRRGGFPVETFTSRGFTHTGPRGQIGQSRQSRGLLISSVGWVIDRPGRYTGPLIKIIMGTRAPAVLETEQGMEA